MPTIPFPHQLEGLKLIEKFNGRALVADPMGCGKSLQALLYVQKHPEISPIIVVCPASLKWLWAREASIHVGMRSEIISGTKAKSYKIFKRSKIFIINYDILYAWVEILKELNPKLVIFDEAHYAGSRSARRTKALKYLCSGVPHAIALSGTPLTNRPAELWPALNVIRPDLFSGFWPFARTYCDLKKTPWGWDFRGASKLPELHDLLYSELMIRRRKEDILKGLPPKIRSLIPVDLNNAARKQYLEAQSNIQKWLLKNYGRERSRKSTRAQMLTQMSYLRHLIARLKLPASLEWVDSFLQESDSKLIIFAIHRDIIRKVHDKYDKISVVVDGSVTGKNREKAVRQFIQRKKTRIFIGNIHAAGDGWSAKGVSSTVFLELPWTPGRLNQAEDRTHGIGRGEAEKHSISYFLLAHDTIDHKMLKLIEKKQKIMNSVLDGGRGHNFDIVDQLAKHILNQ